MNKKFKRSTTRSIVVAFSVVMATLNAMSVEDLSSDSSVIDPIITEIVNDFISAVNSGERNTMQEFILRYYDQRALGRIPLFAVVGLNLGFYYETGGLGYELKTILPSEGNQASAEIFNKLTGATLIPQIPTSGAPSYKINRFIKTTLINTSAGEETGEKWRDDDMVRLIRKCLQKLDEDEEFSGVVLLARDGETLLEEAFRMASKSYEAQNNKDTKFNIASVGKMFTGVAVTQLAEQGRISFDDPVSKYVPAEWLSPKVSEKIQIKHLLTHTSGLGDYFCDAYAQCKVPYFKDLEDYQSLIRDDTLNFEPGTRFSYSNIVANVFDQLISNSLI